jgi:spore coat polysaccharide biosynthesis predicted glycosyltransferase SpsG
MVVAGAMTAWECDGDRIVIGVPSLMLTLVHHQHQVLAVLSSWGSNAAAKAIDPRGFAQVVDTDAVFDCAKRHLTF